MNAINYLRKIQKIDALIENTDAEREKWFAMATSITTSYGGEKVQSSGSQQKMADMTEWIVELDRKLERLKAERQEIIDTIEMLDCSSYDILHKLFVQGKDICALCDIYMKSMSSVKRKYRKALKQMQELLDEREKQ